MRALICAVGLILATSAAVDAQTVPPVPTAATAPANAAPAPPAPTEPGTTNRPRLWLGLAVKSTMTPGPDTSSPVSIGFVWRLRGKTSRTDDRWAFAYRLSSFKSQISSQIAGQEMAVGDARLRPLMAGAEYKMPRGKWTWSAGATAGWSLNRLTTAEAHRTRIVNAMGDSDLVADLHNSLAFSSRLKGWYDLRRRISLMVETSYTVARPLLTMRTAGVESSRRLNADAFIVKTGFVYGVW